MPELRFNLVTKDWVIMAPERAKRPEDFIKKNIERGELPAFKESCPFCPGNEQRTPLETYRWDRGDSWQVRSIPNKFSALTREGELTRQMDGLKRTMSGVGLHDVIIENPRHNGFPAVIADWEIKDTFQVYRELYRRFYLDPRVKMVILFKNNGAAAGTSLEHPHSQIVGTPVTPPQIRYRIEEAQKYYDDTGECLYCRILREELTGKNRIVLENDHVVAFVPYAALSPFHIWIFPKRHMASFDLLTRSEQEALALALQEILQRLYYGLDDPDYNFVLRSVPDPQGTNEHFHFYFAVVPRLTKAAGFELGSGMYINTQLPEKDAEFLRGVQLPDKA
ncbi:MAG: galactose-1-phosphate uridylyltransferase [Deltaproteobacteria bacterium]|nr:galactose-1-phosphate uridylyltransferase [Deltaproteobacteria bacterium]